MSGSKLNNIKSIQLQSYLDAYDSVYKGKEVWYLSAPITSGKNYLEWYCSTGRKYKMGSKKYTEEHYENVIKPNVNKIKELENRVNNQGNIFIINPASINIRGWEQRDYHSFWGKVLEEYIKTIIFLDGWEYSIGSVYEFYIAHKNRIRALDENYHPISMNKGVAAIQEAIKEYKKVKLNNTFMENTLTSILAIKQEPNLDFVVQTDKDLHFKDENLFYLSKSGNVAQFVSFAPDKKLTQRFSLINGFKKNFIFKSTEEAIEVLLKNSVEGTVNIRSFTPDQPKGNPFHYGLSDVAAIKMILLQNAKENRFSIINETIDIRDGGVSGVICGNLIEFAPNSTPKGVDEAGVCSLPREKGLELLKSVYGFTPDLDYSPSLRVEFSIHPLRRGFHKAHTIIWEIEEVGDLDLNTTVKWPNRFSQFIGDKAFGILLAYTYGLSVPRTTVVSKKVAPFSFGRTTNTHEVWIRTCPAFRVPGKYPTFFGWRDPYKIIGELESHKEDKDYVEVVSILSQEAVNPIYSGSLLPSKNKPLIEGVKGKGDDFMLGTSSPVKLPTEVIDSVSSVYRKLEKLFGPVEAEWVFDGKQAWIIQLHQHENYRTLADNVIYPGKVKNYKEFEVKRGLEELRKFIGTIPKGDGVILIGDVGITSHFGDILRRAQIPSYIKK